MDTIKIEVTKAENGYVIQANGKVFITSSDWELGDICKRTVEAANKKDNATDLETEVSVLCGAYSADDVIEAAYKIKGTI